jgi:hypothetical protein
MIRDDVLILDGGGGGAIIITRTVSVSVDDRLRNVVGFFFFFSFFSVFVRVLADRVCEGV